MIPWTPPTPRTQEEKETEFRAAVLHPNYSHCSVRQFCGMQCFVYHRDAKSPSGVELAGGLPVEYADPILCELGKLSHFGPQRGDMALSGV